MRIKPIEYQSTQPIIDRPFEEAEFNSAIQYPFDNWSKSRFSNGKFGVWYGSPELETTIYETVFHWRNGLLADVGWEKHPGIEVERRLHRVDCQGSLINLLLKRETWPDLQSEHYEFCQHLGKQIHHQGHPGLWTASARCEGINAIVFNPGILSNPATECYLTYKLEANAITVWRDLKQPMMSLAH